MDFKDVMRQSGMPNRQAQKPGMYKDFDATELYCPRCKRAVPVKKRLLLVLPDGEKYEYRCVFCAESVGSKIDRHERPVSIIV